MALIEVWFSAVLVVICAQVVMRYVMKSPLLWSEEFSRYSFVWIIYIGCAYCAGTDGHTRIPFLYEKMPLPIQRAFLLVGNAAMCAVLGYVIPRAYAYAVANARFTTAMMHVPMSWLYLALPVGCAATMLQLVLKTILAFDANGGEAV